MITVVLAFHLLLAVTLIGVVLLQKNEGGALGMGGGGGMSGFMTGRTTANLLTRTTAIVAALFFLTSIALAMMAASQRAPRSLIELPASNAPPSLPAAPGSTTIPIPSVPPPAASPPAAPAPAAPAQPSAPLAK
jgi:preprotein translocase subunit SecG